MKLDAPALTDLRAMIVALPVERIEADGPIGDYDLFEIDVDLDMVEVVSRAAVLAIFDRLFE